MSEPKPTWVYALIAIAALLIVGVTWAAETKTFSWIVPTERIDNSPLPGSALTKYELGCASTAAADAVVYSEWPVTDPLIASRVETFAPGQWYCVLRVYAIGDNGDIASEWSNQVFFSISIPPPKSPGGLNVN